MHLRSYKLSINLNQGCCILIIHTAEANPYQGKFVDLDINGLHLSVGHLTAVAFVFLVGLKVRAEPQELKGSIWIMAVIHLTQTLRTHAWIQTDKLKNFIDQPWLLHIQRDADGCLTSKLIEMVPNVEGLIIVASILVVNELYISCKEKKYFLDRDTGSRAKKMLLTALSEYLESQGFSFHANTLLFFSLPLTACLISQRPGRGVRACILRKARPKERKTWAKKIDLNRRRRSHFFVLLFFYFLFLIFLILTHAI